MNKILSTGSNIYEVKCELLKIITEAIKKKGWNQSEAAEQLGIDQPKISQMTNGKVEGFSLERLLSFVSKLNCKVELAVDGSELIKNETD